MIHTPVLQKEVLQYLDPKPNENFVDATIGEGGHAEIILKKNGPEGKVLGIEQDIEQVKNCKDRLKKFEDRLILVNDSYINLQEIVKKSNFGPVNPVKSAKGGVAKPQFNRVNGILFDLGMSTWHLEKSGRGFSFQKDESLDMRYNPEINSKTGEKIINEYSEKEIEKILREFGEERFARRIAREIIKERKREPIKTTFHLVEVIKKAVPMQAGHQYRKIHFATRTFQALRIAVNDELDNLKNVLPQAIEILAKEGVIVVISFHSLEDRIVKNFFKTESKKKLLKILTKKPIKADSEEIKINRRSRSAKLRACQKF